MTAAAANETKDADFKLTSISKCKFIILLLNRKLFSKALRDDDDDEEEENKRLKRDSCWKTIVSLRKNFTI